MEISISEAAKMMKVSRNTIYEKFRSGELSRCPSGKVETSEVFRVFGDTSGRHTRQEQKTFAQSVQSTPAEQDSKTEQLYQAQIKTLEEALKQAREQIAKAEDREQWQRGQIEKLTDTIKLLEAPKPNIKPKSFLDRLLRR